MSADRLSKHAEIYLRAMLELNDHGTTAVSRLAKRLEVTTVSVNEMVRRLGEQGLVTHAPYKGVALTRLGYEAACDVVRRQRLWEVFLHRHLNIEYARVYEMASALGHATAPNLTEVLASFLGNPKTCPHGKPIPEAGVFFDPMLEVPVDRVLFASRGETQAGCPLLRQEERPAAHVNLPLQGTLTLQAADAQTLLNLQAAKFVFIQIFTTEFSNEKNCLPHPGWSDH